MTENHPFSQPTRQSSAAIIFILGGVLKMLFKQLWAVIALFLFNRKSQYFDGYSLVFLGLAGVSAFMSLLNYFRLVFYIKDGELVLEKGVIRKSKINVPLDRVQTVNFRQNILHQMFKVVAVDIDTAGSAGKEFSLHALSRADAELLREVVSRNSSAMVGAQPVMLDGQALPHGIEVENNPAASKQSEIFRLAPLDLLKIGVSQNHLRTAGILVAFFFSFADDLAEGIGVNWEKKMQWWLGTTNGPEILLSLLTVAPVFLFASFIVTLIRTVLQYYDLRFWRTERGFKIVSGLFTRQEVSAVLAKIQYVQWSSSPLMRWFRMMKVRLPQAASVEVRGKLVVGLPGCYEPQLTAVRAAYFPEENDQDWAQPQGVDARIAWVQFLKYGPLPVLVLMEITWDWLGFWALLWLGWLAVAAWLARRYHQSWHWATSEEGLRASWGVLQKNAVLLQWHKVQAVDVRRGFFRNSNLARLTLYTAAGAVRLPFLPLALANSVRDFVLYKVETDMREWM